MGRRRVVEERALKRVAGGGWLFCEGCGRAWRWDADRCPFCGADEHQSVDWQSALERYGWSAGWPEVPVYGVEYH